MLLISYGVDGSGRVLHVDDVPRGKACGLKCAGCGAPLVARKGAIKQHHLAHLSPAPACESWLHSTAKLILRERIHDAMDNGSSLPIRWTCPDDGMQHDKDLLNRKIIDAVEVEYFWSGKNIRPDVVCFASGQPVVIFEVVVTHKPEEMVLESGIPVLEVHISDTAELDNLRSGVVNIDYIHNYSCPDPKCDICGNFSSVCSSTSQLAESLLLDMKKRKSKPNYLKPITQDKFDNFLYPKIRRKVQAYAHKLAELGFEQQSSRPTLLNYRVEGWDLYADLGGTDILKIWEVEGTPAIYAFQINKTKPVDETMREHLLHLLEDTLKDRGVSCRRHFYDV